MDAFHKIRHAEGLRGVFTGWSPTFFGYSVSNLCLCLQRVTY
jgi:hypothetical protein